MRFAQAPANTRTRAWRHTARTAPLRTGRRSRPGFAEVPHLNYGVRTDTLPTIDIDPRNGGDKAWLELIKDNHDVHSWRVATGGGGQHIVFGSTDTPVPSGKLARGVDVKGVGGYIVGVGCLHASGKRYRWFPQCSPREAELKAPPAWLTNKLVKPKWNGEPRARGGDAQTYYNKLLEPALNGERHEKVAALLGHLYGSVFPNRGVLLALVISHVRLTYPDLDGFNDEEIVNIARDLAKSENKKRKGAA
jgi:Bifunctional DNA primase/polymerase, N-terminal